jgi:hypothetical protein
LIIFIFTGGKDKEKDKATTPVPNVSSTGVSPATPQSKPTLRESRAGLVPMTSQYNVLNNYNPRNFLFTLLNAVAEPSAKPWSTLQQYQNHVELTLINAGAGFSNVGLAYLAERCTFSLVDLYRKTGQFGKVAEEYKVLADCFTSVVENGNANSSFGMGTFYWVQFVGQGMVFNILAII